MNVGKMNFIYLKGDFTNWKLFMFPHIQHVELRDMQELKTLYLALTA